MASIVPVQESLIRVLLADSHRLVREGIRQLLEREVAITVAGEAADARELVALAATVPAHVAVVDVTIDGLDEMAVLPRLRGLAPNLGILLLSPQPSEAQLWHGLGQGARAYVLKQASGRVLTQAVRAVARGERFICPLVSELLSGSGMHLEAPGALTARQRQVLGLVARGESSKAIASRLGLSVKTVETHRSEIARRLGVRGLAGLVREALRLGLLEATVPPEDG